ncbi:MAG: glutamate-1-semialdehyde 2,1-aminomutase [Conexivisphaera sp.]
MDVSSDRLREDAERLLPGGVSSPIRASVRPYPFFADRALGARIWTADGVELVDWVMGYGPNLLGHADDRVRLAVVEQVERGWLYGAPTRTEVELAGKISTYYGPGKVRFVNSGGEAAMTAVRLARGATGRRLLIKFDGCYHGASDALLSRRGDDSLGIPSSAGVPKEFAGSTMVLRYNDVDELHRAMKKFGDQVAAVIVEPVGANMGVVPASSDFLAAAKEEVTGAGALLIFDEVVTGFRLGLRGAQGLYGIKPDLTVLGKIIGGGFPVGALVGRSELMDLLAPLGPVYNAGTFNGHPVSMAAGLATLRILEEGWPYSRAERAAKAVSEELSSMRLNGGEVAVNVIGSMFQVFMRKPPVVDADSARGSDSSAYMKFHEALMREGVFSPPSQMETWFASSAHGDEEVSRTIEGIRKAWPS